MADQNSKTVKAKRATIDIGGIAINVYQLPDGSYRLAGRNVTDAIGEDDKTLPRFYGVRRLKDLPRADSSLPQIKANTGETLVPVAIEDAMDYWLSRVGSNPLARTLSRALMSETIERRADRIFNIQRAEADYDAALKVRVGSIRHRKEFTKEIQDFCDRKDGKSGGDQWIIKNATDQIYRILIGADSKRLREIHGLPSGANIRSWLHDSGHSDALDLLSAIETFAAIRVSRGESPFEAIDLVAAPYANHLAHLAQPLNAQPIATL